MDLTALSDADLMALKGGDLSKVSTEGLMSLKSAGKQKTGVDAIPTGGVTAPAKTDDSETFPQMLSRQTGLTARHGIEGLVGTADFLSSPIRGALNLALPNDKQITPLAPKITNALNLPEPQNAQERVVGDMARTMAGGASIGKGAQLATSGVNGVTKAIMEQLAAKQGTQALAGAGAGAGSGVARESGAGPVGQVLAGLAGGVGGAVAPSVGSSMLSGAKRVANIGDQLLPGGAQRSAGRVANAVAGDQADEIINNLSSASRTDTARQAAVPSQNREFAGLMKMAETNAPTTTGVRLDSQAARRTDVLDKVKPDLVDSISAKKSAANTNYPAAFAERVKADPELAKMASNPFFKDAVKESADLAKARNVTFRSDPTQFLHLVKNGLDKVLRRTDKTPLDSSEKAEIARLQESLVKWIGDPKRNPKYEFARAENERLSKPIEQSKVIQSIQDTMEGIGGKERVTQTLNALGRGEGALVKGATGFRKDELSSVLTPRQMKVVNAIENQQQRDATANRFAQEGGKKANLIFQSEELPLTIPNALHRPIMIANQLLKRAEGYGSKKTMDELSRLNLSPREFAEVMKNAKPAVRDKIVKEMILQKAAIGQVGQQGEQQ